MSIAARPAAELESELPRAHATGAWAGPVGAALYLALMGRELDGALPWVWFGLNCLVALISVCAYLLLTRGGRRLTVGQWSARECLLFVSGAAWGSVAALALPRSTAMYGYTMVFVVAGTISVLGLVNNWRSFAAYQVPCLVLPAVSFLVQPSMQSRALGVSVVVFFVLTLSVNTSIRTRLQQIEQLNGQLNVQQVELFAARDQLERALELTRRQADSDPLTGLANRRVLIDRLASALGDRTTVALLFIDLDHFKMINDSLGHGIGDRLLVALSGRFQRIVADDHLLARLGGDEFGVMLPRCKRPHDALEVAHQLLEVASQPCSVDGHTLSIAASIGVALSRPGDQLVDLLRHADVAMYQAKRKGRNGVELYAETDGAAVESVTVQSPV
jgi:diguanylate cyclase (GGDEF)-like protein